MKLDHGPVGTLDCVQCWFQGRFQGWFQGHYPACLLVPLLQRTWSTDWIEAFFTHSSKLGHHEVEEFEGSPSIHSMMLLRPCLTVGSVSLGLNVWPSPPPNVLVILDTLSLWTAADLSPAWRCHFEAGDSFLVLFIHGGGFTVDRDGGIWAVPSSRQARVLVVPGLFRIIVAQFPFLWGSQFGVSSRQTLPWEGKTSQKLLERFSKALGEYLQTCGSEKKKHYSHLCTKRLFKNQSVSLINPGWKETFH